MITLMSPPFPAKRILHLNCSSKSPGGKDYILVVMTNGELWACNGPSLSVRSCRGAIQNPKHTWQTMLSKKTSDGYRVIGEYNAATGWVSNIRETYAVVKNIQTVAPQPPPANPPISEAVASALVEKTQATQHQLSERMKSLWGTVEGGVSWFAALHRGVI